MSIWLVIILVLAASIIFFLVGRTSVKTDGLFIVNDTDGEATRWILDVHVDPTTIPNKKVVRLKVKKITEEGDV